MRIVRVRRPESAGKRSRFGKQLGLKPGDRVEATVSRRIAGPLTVLDIRGVRLMAWMDPTVETGDALYLEVVTAGKVPRLRRLTGGGAFWTLPVGESASDGMNLRA